MRLRRTDCSGHNCPIVLIVKAYMIELNFMTPLITAIFAVACIESSVHGFNYFQNDKLFSR